MKTDINTTDLSKGLQIARFSFVLLALVALVSPLSSALGTGLLSYLPTLLTLAFVAGLVLCMKASPGVGTPWIACSLGCLVLSVGVAFVPMMTLLQFLSFLGFLGLAVAGLLTAIMPFLAFTFFLVYLRVLAGECGQPDIAAHFYKLSFVPIITIVALVAGAAALPAELSLLAPLSALVVGLALVISYSGALGTLVQRLG